MPGWLTSTRSGNLMLMRLGKVLFLVFNLGPTVCAIIIFRTLSEMTMWWVSMGFGLIHWWIVGVYDNFRREAMAARLSHAFELMAQQGIDLGSPESQQELSESLRSLGPFDSWMPSWITALTNLAWLGGAGLLITAIVMWIV